MVFAPVPSAPPLLITSELMLTLTLPAKVLDAFKISVPTPTLVRPPAPPLPMGLLNVTVFAPVSIVPVPGNDSVRVDTSVVVAAPYCNPPPLKEMVAPVPRLLKLVKLINPPVDRKSVVDGKSVKV